MVDFIPFEIALWICLVTYGAMLVVHVVILIGAGWMRRIPIDLVWGGRLKSHPQLVVFESVAVVVTALFLGLTLIRTELLPVPGLRSFAQYSMWALAAFFALNTVGNLAAPTRFEKSMAIMTGMLSLATLRLS